MPDPDKHPDSTLLTRISAGDEQALEQLYDRHKGVVYGLTLQILRDPGAAEEVTLDVFTRVWEQADGYRAEKAAVKTWLVRIARNAAIDRLRRRRARPDQEEARWAEDGLDTLPAGDDVEATVAEREQRQQVQQALATLPPELRQVLALAYLHGYTHSEIAARLQQPLGTVKSRIRSAMLKLQEQLRPPA